MLFLILFIIKHTMMLLLSGKEEGSASFGTIFMLLLQGMMDWKELI